MAQTAEAGGLDSIWLFDHLFFRFDPQKTVGIWECWTLISALAEAANRHPLEWARHQEQCASHCRRRR